MAQKYIVQMVDDLTGEPIPEGDAESVRFALNGETRIIDLTKQHAEELRQAMQPYLTHSRRVEGSTKVGPKSRFAGSSSSASTDMEERRKIREWAKKHGKPVSEKGRISSDIVAEYEKDQRAS